MTTSKSEMIVTSKIRVNTSHKYDISIIEMKNVSRTYRVGSIQVEALKNINLKIKKGELLVILGPSGSGKTTLLNLIGGIDIPTDGLIMLDNISLKNKKQMERIRREKIGFIFQFFNLLPNLTAGENVEYVLELMKQKNRKEKTFHYLNKVGLEERANHFPGQLSGGEQQRVAIARALAKNPLVILADEPTGELDFETGIKILRLLYDLVQNHNTTVVMVTHNQEIAKIADRIVRLSSGQIKSILDNSNSKIVPEKLVW
ncbi:MAG: ABC transporter ATP-binding protein [Candidatus Hodarchaeota archaeon]